MTAFGEVLQTTRRVGKLKTRQEKEGAGGGIRGSEGRVGVPFFNCLAVLRCFSLLRCRGPPAVLA